MSRVASTRWCPTPEQVMILEEMYRGGIRTPNASQVQQITTHLSFFGEVEGKNVFYWFQNHKARDRQKLRRKLSRKERQYQTHDHSLHQIEPSSSAALQQLPLYNSTHFLPQREELKESPKQVMGCSWKVEISERDEMENSSRNYDHNWMMMVDMGSITPSCNRPLKTLQLFPITTTGLKDECTTSQQFSCSTSTN